MNRIFKNLAIYLVIVLAVIALLQYTSTAENDVQVMNYNQFFEAASQGQVGNVEIKTDEETNIITGQLQDGTKFETKGPASDQNLWVVLRENNVNWVQEEPDRPGFLSTMFISFLPILLLVGLFFFLMQQSQGGGNRVMSFGKSKAKLHSPEKPQVTFADVAGVDEVREELQELVDFLKDPERFREIGARIPKGVLLFGPPGTGKTLLARAVAGEAGTPFYTISGSDFVEMFVGVGASRVRDLFENAKKNSPCIVFIDEIDAVGRQRGAGLGGGHDEREQTLNQLLVEMDGFSPNEGIIVVAATNRPDILDPALLRPGRFDRQVVVTQPDVTGRKEILEVHSKGKPLAKDVSLDVIARRTPGFSGADLENLINEAALLAARNDKKEVGMEELENAIERVIAGPAKKSRVISEFEKKLVSYHEIGHALVSYFLPNTDPVHKISIIPRGRAGGYTLLLPKEERYYATRSQLLEQITMLLGGRVAEELVLKEISTGAQNDLERATETARKMVMEYGMSEALGPLTLGKKQDTPFLGRDLSRDRNYSEEIASAIDAEVRRIIDECYRRAENILNENMEGLHVSAKVLFERETIDGADFERLLKHGEISPEGEKPGEAVEGEQTTEISPAETADAAGSEDIEQENTEQDQREV